MLEAGRDRAPGADDLRVRRAGPLGLHFCANCGRPVGGEPVVACEGCGHPLSADAPFCAQCGRPVETSDEAEPEDARRPKLSCRRAAHCGRRDDPALVRSLGALSLAQHRRTTGAARAAARRTPTDRSTASSAVSGCRPRRPRRPARRGLAPARWLVSRRLALARAAGLSWRRGGVVSAVWLADARARPTRPSSAPGRPSTSVPPRPRPSRPPPRRRRPRPPTTAPPPPPPPPTHALVVGPPTKSG